MTNLQKKVQYVALSDEIQSRLEKYYLGTSRELVYALKALNLLLRATHKLDGDFASIPRMTWRRNVCSRYKEKAIDPLIEMGLIECDEIYYVGTQNQPGKSFGYRVTPAIKKGEIRVKSFRSKNKKTKSTKDEKLTLKFLHKIELTLSPDRDWETT